MSIPGATTVGGVARSQARDVAAGRWAAAFASLGAGLVLIILALNLGRYSFWTDEAITGLLLRRQFLDLLYQLATSDSSTSAQPLFYVLLWLWSQLAGTSEAALRVPALLYAAATPVVLWRTLRLAGLTPWIGWSYAASFLALPLVQWYAIEARPYTFILLCVALHGWEMLRVLRDPRRGLGRLALLSVVVVLSYSVAGVAGLLGLWIAAAQRLLRRWHEARGALVGWWLLPPALASLAGAGIVLSSLARASGIRTATDERSLESMIYAFYELLLGRTIGFSVTEIRRAAGFTGLRTLIRAEPLQLLEATVAATVIALILLLGLRRLRLRQDLGALLAALPWLGTALLFCGYALYPGFLLNGRHIIFVVPPLVTLAALGLSRAGRRRQGVALLALWAVGALSLGGLLLDARYAKEDFRSAAAIIQRCAIPPQNTFLVDYPYGFEFYGIAGQQLALDEALARLEQQRPAPTVLVVDTSRFDPTGLVAAAVQRDPTLSRWEVPSLTLVATIPLEPCARG